MVRTGIIHCTKCKREILVINVYHPDLFTIKFSTIPYNLASARAASFYCPYCRHYYPPKKRQYVAQYLNFNR